MDYIPKERVAQHLKLGRKLASFVKVDRYFESLTFDWIALEKHDDLIKATLIRSVNEGDEIFNDVLSFRRLNDCETEFDAITNPFFIGDLPACYQWIVSNYKQTELSFFRLEELTAVYTDLVQKGAFDNDF